MATVSALLLSFLLVLKVVVVVALGAQQLPLSPLLSAAAAAAVCVPGGVGCEDMMQRKRKTRGKKQKTKLTMIGWKEHLTLLVLCVGLSVGGEKVDYRNAKSELIISPRTCVDTHMMGGCPKRSFTAHCRPDTTFIIALFDLSTSVQLGDAVYMPVV